MPTLRPLCAAAAVLLSAGAASAAVQVYVSAPQVQTVDAAIPGATTEDFNASPTGTFTSLSDHSIGTYTSTTAKIDANDKYGGINQGNYLAVPVGGAASVALTSPESYFGVFFSAADGTDTITLYDAANAVLGTFTAQSLTNFLSTPTVTALNGAVYTSSNYKGQPTANGTDTPTLNTGEYYAYLNFFASGAQIARVDFTKTSGGFFESDNHSVSVSAPTPSATTLGSFVSLGTIPEPSAYALLAAGAVSLGALRWVSRRRLTA